MSSTAAFSTAANSVMRSVLGPHQGVSSQLLLPSQTSFLGHSRPEGPSHPEQQQQQWKKNSGFAADLLPVLLLPALLDLCQQQQQTLGPPGQLEAGAGAGSGSGVQHMAKQLQQLAGAAAAIMIAAQITSGGATSMTWRAAAGSGTGY